MITLANIDTHLSQHGTFCLIDWLMADNKLHYSDYEAWRYGRADQLDEAIQLPRKALKELIETIETHCAALQLSTEAQDYFSWGEPRERLSSSKNAAIHTALTQQWMRAQDLPQLDLFMDNSAQIAENQLRDALASRQFDAAQQYLQQLLNLNSQHTQLGAFQDLINYGQHMLQTPRISGDEALVAELNGLQHEVQPLAREVLRQTARDYLAMAWRRLADSLQGQAFDPQQAMLHRSHALRQIPDWPELLNCLQAEPQLYQQPELLLHLADTHAALQAREAELLTWCHFAERFGDRIETAINDRGQRPIAELWDRFCDIDDSAPAQHFAAYLLAMRPGLIHHLEAFPALETEASMAMSEVLRCRLAGSGEIEARERLRGVSVGLLGVCM